MHPLDPPVRPEPRSTVDRALAWIRWFGPLRVASGALGLAALVAVGLWAVQAPTPAASQGEPSGSPPSAASGRVDLDVPTVTLVGRPPLETPATVVVHIAGAVAAPGVHELPVGARVVDAVQAAGGASEGAELDALNLAAPVVDGQRIHVPRVGEVGTAVWPGSDHLPPALIDLNRASATELEELPGIGPAIAGEIVADRDRHGPFATVDDLLRVRGIGPAKLSALRDRAMVS